MSNFIPNSFQIPNAVVDELMPLMSGNAFKCYGVIARLTRGWNKVSDSISRSQLMEKTGIKNGKTIDKCIKELLDLGLICKLKHTGESNEYVLTDGSKNGGTPYPKIGGTPKNTPPPKNGGTPYPKIGYHIKQEIQKPNITPLPPLPTEGADAPVAAEAATAGNEFSDGLTPPSGPVPTKSKRNPAVPVADIVAAYNDVLGGVLPKAVELTDYRKREISARWKQLLGSLNPRGQVRYSGTEDGLAYWRRLFTKVLKNPHWCGDNDRNWRADLDWFMKPRNFVKLVEFIPQEAQR